MERPDFFELKNGEKVKLPFSKEEYDQRLSKLRSVMDKNNLEMVKKHNGLFEKDKLEWIKLSSLTRKKHLFRPWYKRFIPRIIQLLK